jgi:glucans biosynthesis protein C
MRSMTGTAERPRNVTLAPEASPLPQPELRRARRYDIDWLRIAAVLLLIPFHSARVFDIGEAFYAKNDALSVTLSRFITFVAPWHMSLLFFLAGAASWFALGFRSGGRYVGERARRLLVPFVFGLVVLIPPQGYAGMLTNSSRDQSFWGEYGYFWTHFTDLKGYDGTWTPGHLWFILFLFVYSLLGVGLFLWLRRGSGRRLIGAFAAACRVPGVLILIPSVLLLLCNALPLDDLSGQNPVGYFVLIVLGFIVVSDERLDRAVARHWPYVLVLGVAGMALRAGLWPATEEYSDLSWPDIVVNGIVYQFGVWMMIVGLLGLFDRVANRRGRLYGYAVEAAYPFYILHQTVIVLFAYVIVGLGLGIPLAYAVVACGSLVITLVVYDLAVRRWGPVRFLFGMKPRPTTR